MLGLVFKIGLVVVLVKVLKEPLFGLYRKTARLIKEFVQEWKQKNQMKRRKVDKTILTDISQIYLVLKKSYVNYDFMKLQPKVKLSDQQMQQIDLEELKLLIKNNYQKRHIRRHGQRKGQDKENDLQVVFNQKNPVRIYERKQR